MFSGTIHTRDRLHFGRGLEDKVTAITVFERGLAVQRPSVSAGAVAKLWGLSEIQVGDRIGEAGSEAARAISSRRRHWSRSSSRGNGRRPRAAPRRARPARRAGPADQTSGRTTRARSSRSRSTARSRRRSSRRRWQTSSASRSHSARRRRSTSSGPSAPARRSRSCTRNRIRFSPRSGCASSRRPRAPASSSDSRSMLADSPAVPLQDARALLGAHGSVRPRDAAGGPLRLAGHGLRRDDDQVHLQRPRRPSVEAGTAQHGGRLPKAHAARPHAGARAGRDGGLRADRPSAASRSRRERSVPVMAALARLDAAVETPSLRGELSTDRDGVARGAGRMSSSGSWRA